MNQLTKAKVHVGESARFIPDKRSNGLFCSDRENKCCSWWVWLKVTADLFFSWLDMMQCRLYTFTSAGAWRIIRYGRNDWRYLRLNRIPLRGNSITAVDTKCRLGNLPFYYSSVAFADCRGSNSHPRWAAIKNNRIPSHKGERNGMGGTPLGVKKRLRHTMVEIRQKKETLFLHFMQYLRRFVCI